MHHVKILFTYITDLKIPWWWLWQQRCLYFSHRYWTGDTAHIAILFFHNRDKFGGKSAMFANTREKIEGMHAQIGLCLLCRTWCMCAGHCQHWRTVTVQLSVFIPFGLHGYEECWFPPIFLHGRKTKWAAVTRIGIGTEFCTDSPFYIYGSLLVFFPDLLPILSVVAFQAEFSRPSIMHVCVSCRYSTCASSITTWRRISFFVCLLLCVILQCLQTYFFSSFWNLCTLCDNMSWLCLFSLFSRAEYILTSVWIGTGWYWE